MKIRLSSGDGSWYTASAPAAAHATPDVDDLANVRVLASTTSHNTDELDDWEMTNRFLLSIDRGFDAARAGRISPTSIKIGMGIAEVTPGGDAKLFISLVTFARRSFAARFLAFFLIDFVFILLVGGSSTVFALSSSDGSVCEASAGGSSGG